MNDYRLKGGRLRARLKVAPPPRAVFVLGFGAYNIGPALLHPLTLVYAASGSAMISATLRIKKP